MRAHGRVIVIAPLTYFPGVCAVFPQASAAQPGAQIFSAKYLIQSLCSMVALCIIRLEVNADFLMQPHF
jgi:hypothetical protein